MTRLHSSFCLLSSSWESSRLPSFWPTSGSPCWPGYFICGVILANCGILDHIPNSDVSIQALSEVGIILLMFTLGLEFSVDELKHLRKTALVGGGIQMFICTAAFGLGASLRHRHGHDHS